MNLSDTKIYQALHMRDTVNSRRYIGYLSDADEDAAGFLEYTKLSFPDYPDHGIEHSYRILDGIYSVIKSYIPNLTDTELFCLIMSALFHDTGMCLAGFACRENLRKNHEENASLVIDKYFDEKLSRINYKDRIKSVITFVCKAHGMNLDKMYNDRNFSNIDTLNGDIIRTAILSVLLRIGDLLDLDEKRINWLARYFLADMYSDEANVHNERHLKVRKYYIDETIDITVVADNIAEYKIWSQWFTYLENEILYANTNLNTYGLFIPAAATQIVKSNEAKFDIEELHFELDDKGGLLRIISESIYTNEFDFVREIIQNAIDATLVSVYANERYSLGHPSPRSWSKDADIPPVYVAYSADYNNLYVIDTGIGMDSDDLKRFLFKISSSGYKDIKERSFPFPSIAKYGIGFVATLINADEINVYTNKASDSEMNHVSFQSGLNQAFIQKDKKMNTSGTAVVLKLKHCYTYKEIQDYITRTFIYPSVDIICVDLDKLLKCAENCRVDDEIIQSIYTAPYRLSYNEKTVSLERQIITKPLLDKLDFVQNIKMQTENLMQWLRDSREMDDDESDTSKYSKFTVKMEGLKELLDKAGYLNKIPLFKKLFTGKKEIFNDVEEYIKNLIKVFKFAKEEEENYLCQLREYPLYSHVISSRPLLWLDDWKYFVLEFDDDLEVSSIELLNSEKDLSTKSGILMIKHNYTNYDSGVEYAAINGFMFNKGAITNQIKKINGYHETLFRERKDKSFIVGDTARYNSSYDELEAAFYENSYDEDDYYQIYGGDGDFIHGVMIENETDNVSIVKNKIVRYTSGIDDDNSVFDNKNYMLINAFKFNDSICPENDVELDKIEAEQSIYCQDGIVIPFKIDDIFPLGYTKIKCNTTFVSRLPLNVTRHEASGIRTDIDNWFDSTGVEIQNNMLKTVSQSVKGFNLSFDINSVIHLSNDGEKNVFGPKCENNLKNFMRIYT